MALQWVDFEKALYKHELDIAAWLALTGTSYQAVTRWKAKERAVPWAGYVLEWLDSLRGGDQAAQDRYQAVLAQARRPVPAVGRSRQGAYLMAARALMRVHRANQEYRLWADGADREAIAETKRALAKAERQYSARLAVLKQRKEAEVALEKLKARRHYFHLPPVD